MISRVVLASVIGENTVFYSFFPSFLRKFMSSLLRSILHIKPSCWQPIKFCLYHICCERRFVISRSSLCLITRLCMICSLALLEIWALSWHHVLAADYLQTRWSVWFIATREPAWFSLATNNSFLTTKRNSIQRWSWL